MTIPAYFTISEINEKFRKKEFSATELVSAHLDLADALQPRLNAFVHLDRESAIAKACACDARLSSGGPLRPLDGVPLTVKSSLDVAGWPCPAGSLLRKDYVPTKDAFAVNRLEQAGAILLGNTNTPEFLMAYETDNLVTGKTSNPWNLEFSAGGSSGGEAAAIASGCSVAGLGSDGGGSIRTPAHFCGICGLKPTPGRIAATGHYPPGAGAFGWIGVVGPMARTVGDLAILLDAVAGSDPGDALSVPVPLQQPNPPALRGMRVGLLESPALPAATPETQAAVARAAKLLERSGFTVEPFALQKLDQALDTWWYFFGNVIGDLLHKGTKGREGQLSPMLREFLAVVAEEPTITLDSFMESCVTRDLLRENILRQMRDTPVLLSAVSTAPAFRHGSGTYQAGNRFNYRHTMRYSQWLNLTGFPGLSLPMGKSNEGLPINVQLIGRPYEEETLLSVGASLEAARGPWEPPPIS